LIRVALGWSQAELARRAGVSVSAVAKFEKERRNLNVLTFKKIVGALGISADVLLDERIDDTDVEAFLVTRDVDPTQQVILGEVDPELRRQLASLKEDEVTVILDAVKVLICRLRTDPKRFEFLLEALRLHSKGQYDV
jgi:transcriptional regulator with XRE-family HTH domain